MEKYEHAKKSFGEHTYNIALRPTADPEKYKKKILFCNELWERALASVASYPYSLEERKIQRSVSFLLANQNAYDTYQALGT
ncbi:17131_t:CDS:2 [Funneliformis geosporum]|uniref:17131_t:CDS:1 n=1 Tax=Funneliformis geosporum TaxID=1117311 RepID=A0A9W4WS12_9GLOM|nr:17131_t:CDS:2 [Funneliformis geosporum]